MPGTGADLCFCTSSYAAVYAATADFFSHDNFRATFGFLAFLVGLMALTYRLPD